ncbi:MAG TPA: tetratricopeptide repeat protein, partial [Polyangia bacterium]|nr:tetratricopeptide repeat protein [Polyangia bacterium]
MGIFDRIAGTLDELTRDAGGPADAKEEIELAWAFAERGDLATAEQRLRDVAARFPNLAPAFARLGAVLARRGSVDEAIAAYGRAVDLDGDHPADWFALGELLSRAGRFEPARDAFRRTLALAVDGPDRGRAHAALGRLYAAHGHLGKAMRELQKALEVTPGDQALAADYGRVLARLGDRQGADWLTRAAREAGADPTLFIEAADAGDNPSVAEALLREGLIRAPNSARLRAALARYLSRRGQTEEALALAVESLAAAPADPAALAALRQAYAAAHRWTEALHAARREAELGVPAPLEDLVALALAARDREVLRQSLLRAAPDDPAGTALLTALRAFLDGAATEADLMKLAAVAPDEETQETRRFVVRALAPPPIPADNLFALLGYAHQLASRTPELLPLVIGAAHALDAFDRPLLVAVMGEFNAGKSSFVNALLGEAIAPVGVTPTTATINVLRHGPVGGRVVYHDGTARDLGVHSVGPFLRDVSDQEAGAIRLVEIFYPL